jgi:glutathione synthase
MRIAVQMDPIETMIVERDTSLALMIEAQARGAEVWWFTPDELFFERSSIRMVAHRVSVFPDPTKHYEALDTAIHDASAFDVILIRQDPPFDMGYVSNTYLLELVDSQRTLVINHPRGVRNIPEKLSALRFGDLIPPTFVGRNLACIRAFANQFDHIVLKSAFLAGGEGVIKARASDPDFDEIVMELLTEVGKEPLIVQEFLSAVREGDKRVFVLGGEAIGAVRRLPQGGDFRANLHAGGLAVQADLDERDREIVARVAPLLAQEQILFAGLDVIDGRLTEINVTSPTLVRELQRFSGVDLPGRFWDRVTELTRERRA